MAVTPRRLATALWISGAAALALAAGLGSRLAQEHLGARRAWLLGSADVGAADYDAARSDALYAQSAESLDQLETWATVGGAGLLALVLGLLMRRSPRGPAHRPWLRGTLALVAGLSAHGALTMLAAGVDHELLGPLLETCATAVAPFVALTTAALVWITRRGARSTTAGSAEASPPGPRP